MDPGTIAGYGAVVVSGLTAAFAFIANKEKNKSEGANVVIGGYDKLAEDLRLDLDRAIVARDKAIEQREQMADRLGDVIKQNGELTDQNGGLQRAHAALQEEVVRHTNRIIELERQLAEYEVQEGSS